MAWIKRNLFFVLSLAAGLALTGYCAHLFAGDLSRNSDLNKDYQDVVEQLRTLQKKALYPSDTNIARAKEERSRVVEVENLLRKAFAPFPTPPKEDEKGFSAYLERTIDDLKAEAEEDDVVLPDNFAFAFTDLRHKLKYPQEDIQPWMRQLTEIRALSDILFGAKINSLTSLKRVPVSTNDVFATPTESFPAKITSTPLGTITPYKVEFRGFTWELASVMNGLARSSNCFIVKNIVVKLAGTRVAEQNRPATTPVVTPPPPPTPPSRSTTPPSRGPTTPPARGTPPPRGATSSTNQPPQPPPLPAVPGRGRGRRAGASDASPPVVAAVERALAATPAAGARGASSAPNLALREEMLSIVISVEAVRLN